MVTLPTVTIGSSAAKLAAGVAAVKVIGAAPVGTATPPAGAPPAAGAAGAALLLLLSLPHPAKAAASKLAAAKLIQRHIDRFLLDRSEHITAVPFARL
jgi:hypothetical protein